MLQASSLSSLAGVRHAFFTRSGGVVNVYANSNFGRAFKMFETLRFGGPVPPSLIPPPPPPAKKAE